MLERGQGWTNYWTLVQAHRKALAEAGDFTKHRQQQLVRWMWSMISDRLLLALREHPAVSRRILPLEAAVTEGKVTASQAAVELLEAFGVAIV